MKKQHGSIYVIFILFVLSFIVDTNAQNMPLKIESAQFRNDNKSNRWELYYSYPDTSVVYLPHNQGNGYIGSLHIKLQITSDVKGEILQKEWIADNIIEFPIRRSTKNLVGQQSFILPFGQYLANITIFDEHDSTKLSKRSFPLIIHSFSSSSIQISDIELASHLSPILEENINTHSFEKGAMSVVPNPEHEYIGDSPSLSMYYEIYNASTLSKDSISIEYKILDAAKREQFTVVSKTKILNDIHSEFPSIPINALSSGIYYLQVTVRESESLYDSIVSIKKFYVLNPEIPVELAQAYSEEELFLTSEFATFSAERVQEEFLKASVLATQSELQLFKSLSEVEAKRKFLFRFWRERDTDISTLINEKYDEFCEVVKKANIFYSNIVFKEGWKSDPGRIMRKYGFPTQIDRHPQVGDAKSYEEWFYAGIQGGIYFQLVDIKGYGNFIQVNSTAIGESRNPNWMEQYVQQSSNQSAQDSLPK